jgi:hypothetical protein
VFAGAAQLGVRGIDGFLVGRQARPVVEVALACSAALRHFHVRTGAAVSAVGDNLIPTVVRASMRPCSRAVPMSRRAPGNAGKAPISRPAGAAMTCTFTPCLLCFPSNTGIPSRDHADPIGTHQHPVDDDKALCVAILIASVTPEYAHR